MPTSRKKEVNVRLFGALANLGGTRTRVVDLPETLSLIDFLKKLGSGLPEEFNSAIRNQSDFLVLVNGTEISVLDGMGTEICAGDEVVLLPVSHGGSDWIRSARQSCDEQGADAFLRG